MNRISAPAAAWQGEGASRHSTRHVVAIAGSVSVDDADAMEKAVLENLGIAILPAWNAVGPVRRGELEVLLEDYSVPGLPLHAVYPETRWMSLRARSFLDLIVARSNRFSEALP
jgi:DNA-binding transcriptional LysR family regulator